MQRIKETTFDQLPDLELLAEVKMSRVYHHLVGDAPIGIITAYRGEQTEEQSIQHNKALASSVRSAGFGFFWVDGAWIENEGTEDETHVSEVSLFIIGNESNDNKLFDFLQLSAQRFNQDGFVFKASYSTDVGVYDANGNLDMDFSQVNMDKLSSIYTKLKTGPHAGRSFFFEGVRAPIGYAGKLRKLKE